jgi:hypothetical protein
MAGGDRGVTQHGLVPVAITFTKKATNPIESEGVDHQPHGQVEIPTQLLFRGDGFNVAVSCEKQVNLNDGHDAKKDGQLDPEQTHPDVLKNGFGRIQSCRQTVSLLVEAVRQINTGQHDHRGGEPHVTESETRGSLA